MNLMDSRLHVRSTIVRYGFTEIDVAQCMYSSQLKTVPHLEIVTVTHDTTFLGVFMLPLRPCLRARGERSEA